MQTKKSLKVKILPWNIELYKSFLDPTTFGCILLIGVSAPTTREMIFAVESNSKLGLSRTAWKWYWAKCPQPPGRGVPKSKYRVHTYILYSTAVVRAVEYEVLIRCIVWHTVSFPALPLATLPRLGAWTCTTCTAFRSSTRTCSTSMYVSPQTSTFFK